MNNRFKITARKDGSAFITVILFTFLMTTLIASVIGWTRNERLLTVRNAHWLEARSAAEAIAEYAFAQIDGDFGGHSQTPTFDPGGTGTNNFPLQLPPTAYWDAHGHVDLTTTNSATKLQVIAEPPQQIPSTGFYYVDPTLPNNASDPLAGQWIQRNDVEVIARASVLSPEGGPELTTYIMETISVRGAPLFANAIFYSNVDLEIFPGPAMTITGPVRTNGNMFVSSQGSSLTFKGPVSMAGNLYHAWSNSASQSEGSGSETLGSSPVYFENTANTSIPLLQTSVAVNGHSYGNIWVDSTMGSDSGVAGLSNLSALVSTTYTNDFRAEANTVWGGNLQTAAMGVQVNNPISFSQVIDSSGDTPNPHSIIDPPATTSYLNSDPNYTAAKESVEEEKFSTQAGLYILVTINAVSGNTSPPTASIQLYGPGPDAPNYAAATVQGTNTTSTGPNGGPLIATYTNSTTNGMVQFLPYISSTSGTSTTVSTTYAHVSGSSYTRTVTTATAPASQTNYSTGSNTPVTTGSATVSSSSAAVSASSLPGSTTVTSSSMATSSSSTTTISQGMFDQRREMPIDLVQVNMSVLTAAIKDMINGTVNGNAITYTTVAGTITHTWGATETLTGSIAGSSTSTPWNGGIYIDVEAPNSETSTQSASVMLTSGTVTSGSSLAPAFGTNANGLTIATNAPIYILGNYNADGTINSATSGTTPDDGKTDTSGNISAESPSCIAADAITVLSQGFSTSASLTRDPAASASVEIAAALLTGIEPTTAGASSGGAHNLPRFLEDWSQTVAIRGSLTCLYQSEIGVQPWSTAYYGAPTRVWGFDVQFSNGHFPPLCPKVMSYRRVQFSDMSSTSYGYFAHSWYPSEF